MGPPVAAGPGCRSGYHTPRSGQTGSACPLEVARLAPAVAAGHDARYRQRQWLRNIGAVTVHDDDDQDGTSRADDDARHPTQPIAPQTRRRQISTTTPRTRHWAMPRMTTTTTTPGATCCSVSPSRSAGRWWIWTALHRPDARAQDSPPRRFTLWVVASVRRRSRPSAPSSPWLSPWPTCRAQSRPDPRLHR